MYVLHCRVVVLTMLELACVRTLFTDPASSAVWRSCACCVTCAGEAKCEALSAKSVAPLHAGGFWCVAGHTRSVVVPRVYHASALTPFRLVPMCVCVRLPPTRPPPIRRPGLLRLIAAFVDVWRIF